MDNCFVNNQFYPGTNAISLVNHSPEVKPGDMVRIVRIWEGNLCAVQLPNGMIHRWFASFELEPEYNYSKCPLEHGGFATIINTEGHGNPPHIEVGTTVKIVRCIPTLFYDVILCTEEYHRWLADFELAYPI